MNHRRVNARPLPPASALHKVFQPGDFLDCYCVEAEASPRHAADIITDFPGWARSLMSVRRMVTAPFGLRNDPPDGTDRVGIFPVVSETSEELIAGFDDKHLDFRVSVQSRGGVVYLSTWVRTHHLGGRAYLAGIMPFHIVISRNALARVAASPDNLQPA